MLSLDRVQAFYGASQVLHGVSLTVRPGEIVSLLGRNGAGRSTTLKAVMGLLPWRGSIAWRGVSLAGRRPHEVARLGLGYVPEDRQVFPDLTVHHNLLLGEKPRRWRAGAAGRAPRWSIADVYRMFPRLHERRDAPAAVLSGGEQQMLTLGRTLVGDPELVMVDEPTEGLAPMLVEQVGQTLRQLAAAGVGVLLVEQKLAIALAVADRCLVMGRGEVVFDGSPQALAADAALRREWLEV